MQIDPRKEDQGDSWKWCVWVCPEVSDVSLVLYLHCQPHTRDCHL